MVSLSSEKVLDSIEELHVKAWRPWGVSAYMRAYAWTPLGSSDDMGSSAGDSSGEYFIPLAPALGWWTQLPSLRLFWRARGLSAHYLFFLVVMASACKYGFLEVFAYRCLALHVATFSVGVGGFGHALPTLFGYTLVMLRVHFSFLTCRLLSLLVVGSIIMCSQSTVSSLPLLLLTWYLPMYPQGGLTTARLQLRPDASDDDVRLCNEVLNWLMQHSTVMPRRRRFPTPDQRDECALARRYTILCANRNTWSSPVQRLARLIEERRSNEPDVKTCCELEEWLDAHEGALPQQIKTPVTQSHLLEQLLAKRWTNLRAKPADQTSEYIQQRLRDIDSRGAKNYYVSPFKMRCALTQQSMAAKKKSKSLRAQSMFKQVAQQHANWCYFIFIIKLLE